MFGLIRDLDNDQYYVGYRVENKPQGYGVLLTPTQLYQGMWFQGQFITGYVYDLKEQKFSFCLAKPNETTESEAESSASGDTNPAE